jgi:flagellar FliL protein
MSDTDDDEEDLDEVPLDEGDDDDEGGGKRKRGGKRKLILFVGAPLVVLILAVAGLFVMGIGPFGGGDEEEVAVEESHGEEGDHGEGAEGGEHGADGGAGHVGFYELPQMTVNLNTTDGSTAFLRITVSLEIANDTPENRAQLDTMLPRVLDNFQTYMRELRLDDLSGSAGLFRLKQEMLSRVNRAVDPVQVSDVLFSELLVQ